MSSGGQQPVTQQTTQTKDPWSVAQPFLTQSLNQAEYLRGNGIGYQPYPGTLQAPMSGNLSAGLNQQATMANATQGGTPGVLAGQNLATNMIQNQGLSPELKSLYEQAQGDQNPYLQSILDTNNRRIGDRVNASMSGAGRYGSGAHTDVMTRALAESADPILAQDYARRQQQMQGIAEGGLQRAGQWAQLTPTLDAAQYAPAERLANVGQYETQRAQQALDDQIKQWNASQALPWESLARYNAIVGGAGGLGGTQVTSSPLQQPSATQSLFGGALAGAGLGSMFGPVGTGVGAAGGGLLGLLGR